MTDSLTGPLRAVVGFSTEVIDEAVALDLVAAESVQDILRVEGRVSRFVMTPDAAIEIGQALVTTGSLAKRSGAMN